MFSSNPKKNSGLFKFDTFIGCSSTIEGNLHLSGNIRVDGKLIGNIYPINGNEIVVALGESGDIKGDVHCNHLIVSGTIIGNINATFKVEILDQAKIEGDISYNTLSMDPGATVQGHFFCNLIQQESHIKNIASPSIPQAQERLG